MRAMCSAQRLHHRIAHFGGADTGGARTVDIGRGQALRQHLLQGRHDALGGFSQAQSGETLKALDAVASFVADWKAPKGPLVLGLKPTKTAGLDDIDKIMVPDALSTIFGFTATYPGTRASAGM